MQRSSELIVRNQDTLPTGNILLFNPPCDGLAAALAPRHRVSVFCQDYGDYQWFQASGADVSFGLTPEPAPEPADDSQTVILFLPREKERLDMLLHALAEALSRRRGTLWLVGENREGIKSAGKRLAARFAVVEKRDNARHCVLFHASDPVGNDPFQAENYGQKWELPMPTGMPGEPVRLVSLPGVFAHGRLDSGTALLLRHLGDAWSRLDVSGSVLDFGCGAGVIGLTLARANPALRLTLADSNAAALTCAQWSAAANGFGPETVRVEATAGLQSQGAAYDWIFSNPPFHRGVDTDYEVARQFFAAAASRLTKKGKLMLVCNRHLPYEPWLEASFSRIEEPAANREFRILSASGARATGRN